MVIRIYHELCDSNIMYGMPKALCEHYSSMKRKEMYQQSLNILNAPMSLRWKLGEAATLDTYPYKRLCNIDHSIEDSGQNKQCT